MITGRLAAPSRWRAVLRCGHRRGRLAFLAGQGAILNGTVAGGPIAEQTRVTLQNLAAILKRLGAVVSGAC
jgi:enamine deaminase RidA (YjgF/YER057c/UK114 family)